MKTIHAQVVEDPSLYNLQAFLMFGIAVAGKSADSVSEKIQMFLANLENGYGPGLPFDLIRNLLKKNEGCLNSHVPYWTDAIKALKGEMQLVKLGQYTKLVRAFGYLALTPLDLTTCTVEQLEAIPGCGPKTARYFLMYTRPNFKGAALDTHILKYLSGPCGLEGIPSSTPPKGAKYNAIEEQFLKIANLLEVEPKELDNAVWQWYSRGVPLPAGLIGADYGSF